MHVLRADAENIARVAISENLALSTRCGNNYRCATAPFAMKVLLRSFKCIFCRLQKSPRAILLLHLSSFLFSYVEATHFYHYDKHKDRTLLSDMKDHLASKEEKTKIGPISGSFAANDVERLTS